MAEILIVDDERVLRDGMKAVLTGEGHVVRMARDGEDALRKIAEKRPDLVLMDVMMPKMNGFRACEEIRKQDQMLPVVFLTAKDAEADQVRGIGLGGDDYVSKTASESVLLARIARVLERSRQFDALLAQGGSGTVRLGSVTVDLASLSVVGGDGEIARLTKSEADILRLLDGVRGRYLTVDEIIAGLKGGGYACADTLVYVHVSHLRRKLGPAGDMIASARNAGYCLLK